MTNRHRPALRPGDSGTTTLMGNQRVSKHSTVVETLGDLLADYPDRSREQMAAIAPAYAEARRLHRPLPGREPRT